jgi:hypothetical protein
MIIKFRMWRTIVDFQTEIPIQYDEELFEFNTRSDFGLLYNTAQIQKRLREIDEARNFKLIGLTPINIEGITFHLDCYLAFHTKVPSINWSIRGATLPEPIPSYLRDWSTELRPVLIGTVTLHRPQVQEEYKRAIRDRARRLAELMRINGDAIIALIDEIEQRPRFFR